MEEKCKSCHYYKNTTCKRFPPVYNPNVGFSYPQVSDDDWCGEWRNKQ